MRYFRNLEFYADSTDLGPATQRKRDLLTAFMYLLLSLGIFSREAIRLSPLSFNQVHWGTLGAAFVVGLAIMPPIIRWVNRRRSVPGIEQVLTAFSIGFFVDLSSHGILTQAIKILGLLK